MLYIWDCAHTKTSDNIHKHPQKFTRRIDNTANCYCVFLDTSEDLFHSFISGV